MELIDTRQEMLIKATEVLTSVLAEISAVKVREIRPGRRRAGTANHFRANVEVYGRPHTLECEIASDVQPARLRSTIGARRKSVVCPDAAATKVIIAPRQSVELQALCRENQTGFLDFDGNARLSIGEVFILKRTIPLTAQCTFAHELPVHTQGLAATLTAA